MKKAFTRILAMTLCLMLPVLTGAMAEVKTIADPPITLSAHIHWNDIYVLSDDWIVTQEAGRMTGVNLKGTASAMTANSTEAFNLMIAGRDIPDLVGGKSNDLNKYGQEGAFLPLNDLIDQYAPTIKAFFDENPDIVSAITAPDGNIYYIPFVYGNDVSEAWFIREDWLNKLGLEAPTTVEELHDVLSAFTTQDPNGNGQQDEIGYFTRIASGNTLIGLLSLFGVNSYWHVGKDGQVAYGQYTPQFKSAMQEISQWYAEGLIDPEIFTRGAKARDMLFPENNGGVIHDWIPSTTGFNAKMEGLVENFKIVGMLPPKDINGDQWEVASRDRLNGYGWAIGAGTQYAKEAMEYMDFWWTEEGRRLQTYGVEGVTYTMVDGEPVYTDAVLNASTSINDYMRRIGGQVESMASLHDASYERFMMDDIGFETTQMYANSGLINSLYPKVGALAFSEEELETITNKFPTCETYMNEMLQKWTFDGSTIEAEFDTYMHNLAAMGMDEVVAAYQSAYDRAKANQ